MANGGKRPGAGRRKGSKNKRTQEVQAAVNAGIDPLGYMLRVMHDPAQPQDRRHDLARAMAPYCHPRPASVGRLHVTATVPRRSSDSRTILGRYVTLWDSWTNGVTFPGLPDGDVLAEHYVSLVRKMVVEETCHGRPKE